MKYKILVSMLFCVIGISILNTVSLFASFDRSNIYEGYIFPDSAYKKVDNTSFEIGEGENINSATGDLELKETDLVLEGRKGLDLALTRYYRLGNSNLREPFVDLVEGEEQEIEVWQVYGMVEIQRYSKMGVPGAKRVENFTDPNQFTISEKADALLERYKNDEFSETLRFEDASGEPYYESYKFIQMSVKSYRTDAAPKFYGTRPGVVTVNQRHFDIGAGWSFEFPFIENRRGNLYLHYGSTGVWHIEVEENGEISLDGYDLKDISIKRENVSRSDFEMDAFYVVSEKDGKKIYFAEDGRLLAIEDRFGNNIRFFHTDRTWRDNDYNVTTPVITRIVDSVGREILINYNDTDSTVNIRWGTNEIVYHKKSVKDITNADTAKERGRFENEFVLYKVVDQEGGETKYDYDINYAMDNYFNRNEDHYNGFDKDDNGKPVLDENGNPVYSKRDNDSNSDKFSGVYNYYACLSTITYPTMAKTHYEYNRGVRYVVEENDDWDDKAGEKIADRNIKNLGPDGSMYFYRVIKRYEEDKEGRIYNEKEFNYKKTESEGVFCQYDGYPLYGTQEDIPDDFEVKTVVEDTSGNEFTYTYNNKLLCLNVLNDYADGSYNEEMIYRYDNNRQMTLAVKNVFNPSTGEFISYAENYAFDKYRNLNYQWGHGTKRASDSKTNYNELSITDYDPLDSEYRTTYEYNPTYHYMTSIEYKKDRDTYIKHEYVPTSNEKSIELENVYEKKGANDYTLKEKMEYVYDTYGNVVEERRYLEDCPQGEKSKWEYFIPTFYEYDGRYKGLYPSRIYYTDLREGSESDDELGELIEAREGLDAGVIDERYSYDFYGNLNVIIDGEGYRTNYRYDNLGRVTTIINPDGTRKEFKYTSNADENSVETIMENGSRTKEVYDEFGNLVKTQVFVDGEFVSIEKIEYDSNFRVDTERNLVNGGFTNYKYFGDGSLRLKETRDNANKLYYREVNRYEVVNDGLEKYFKTSNTILGDESSPSISTAAYEDKKGNLKMQVRKRNNGEDYKDTFNYDYLGNVTDERIARFYDESDSDIWRKSVSGDLLEWTSKYEYDYAGRLVRLTNINGHYMTNEYDALGRKIRVTDYKGNNRPSTEKYYTTYIYDNMDRLIKEKIPFEKDEEGKVIYSKNLYGYDRNGNLRYEKTTANKPEEELSFNEKWYVYDRCNMLTGIKNVNNLSNSPKETWTQYYYDESGNKLRMYTGLISYLKITGLDEVEGNDEVFNVKKYEYNKYTNQLEKVIDHMGYEEIYEHDLNGDLISKIDRNNNEISYEYDILGRMESKSVKTSDGIGDASYFYTYKLTGMKRSETGGEVDYTYTYDELGRLVTVDESKGVIKSYGYDASDNRTSFELKKDGEAKIELTYEYDGMDRLKRVLEPEDQIAYSAFYVYDENGNRSILRYVNADIYYDYNLANNLVSLENSRAYVLSSKYISRYHYEYYLDGNQSRKYEEISGNSTQYIYDGLGRLYRETDTEEDTIVKRVTYEYDASHNRRRMSVEEGNLSDRIGGWYGKSGNAYDAIYYTTSYKYDKNNRLTHEIILYNKPEERRRATFPRSAKEFELVLDKREENIYNYDRNGNQIFKKQTVLKEGDETSFTGFVAGKQEDTGGIYFYEYDGFNRLIGFTGDGKTASYTYNGDGLRTTKTVNGEKTRYIYDAGNIVLEIDGLGDVQSRYIR
ncbi:hypothetical protein RBH29_05195, partial [Herbivorax sp. ANBcel31]|uniref:hypothetical protein n=1 Tax=Herbivorax sp. ANBcel31 TaxID=3069754 RepID=UPI0027B70C5D